MQTNVDYAALLTEFGSATYEKLLPAQDAVLAAYAEHHTSHTDIAVELPTGAGKSLIALLIAEAWRQVGRSAVILSGNKVLARQMEQQADDLGVSVCRLEGGREQLSSKDLRAVQRKQTVGVMNYWVTSTRNPSIDLCSLVVMDDAHLADGPLQSLYSVEINRFDHADLFERLVVELAIRLPHYASLADAAGGDRRGPGTTEAISFYDQHRIEELLATIVDGSPLPSDLAYRWGRLRERLAQCVLLVSRNALWLRPWVYPLQTNDHYQQAEQRLYMSATIGDPADLSRRSEPSRSRWSRSIRRSAGERSEAADRPRSRRGLVADECRPVRGPAGARQSLSLCTSHSEVVREQTELKIEHEPHNALSAGDVDQALGQVSSERVRDANYPHRLHNSPNERERREDSDAEWRLHADVYFLALAIRRVLLFHDVFAQRVDDQRLGDARAKFDAAAPNAKELRDFYEHLDEYLLDSPRKHVRFPGRAAPVLVCRWDCDNVIVRFGEREIDVTLAALAAIDLGRASEALWDEHLERTKRENRGPDLPPSDGIARVLALTMGVSTIIGGKDEGHVQHTGTLLGIDVQEADSGR